MNTLTKIKLTGGIVFTLLTIIIVLQNTAAIETRLLFFTVTMPRAVLLLLTFASGVIVGLLIAFGLTRKQASGK
ncbi:MAG: LapA family protein [Desulfobacterales bacterium]|nr:LapA family protein [Desulfobacterales bacterium]